MALWAKTARLVCGVSARSSSIALQGEPRRLPGFAGVLREVDVHLPSQFFPVHHGLGLLRPAVTPPTVEEPETVCADIPSHPRV
jgi:hypothetical protein